MSTPCKNLFVALAVAAMPAAAAAVVVKAPSAKAEATGAKAYYYTPMGITFEGADKTEKLGADMAYGPVNFWFETAAEQTSGRYQWDFPTAVNADGTVKMGSATTQALNFRMTTAGKYAAPVLTMKTGLASDTYTMAEDGVMYGSLGTPERFAVNYRPGQTVSFETADECLTANSESANAYLSMIMAGGIYSDFKIHGFAESFYYSKDFWLQAIGAEVSSNSAITADNIAVKVFKREKTSVSTEEIAQLHVADVCSVGNNRYYVTFKPDEAVYVSTAMQVVVVAPEGKLTQFAPVFPTQDSYHASNAGTCSIYADFSLVGKPVKKQYCDFFGTELTDEDDATKPAQYLNHWNVGIYGSYEKPAGVDGIIADQPLDESPLIYNLQGICVAADGNLDNLPAGIYIANGKKILKK